MSLTKAAMNINGETTVVYTYDTGQFYDIFGIGSCGLALSQNSGKQTMTDIKNDLTKDERELIGLADEMASAMSNLNSQTYDSFISARDNLRAKIAEIVNKTINAEDRIQRLKEYARTF